MSNRKHILVVEDEAHLALGIRYNLEAEGYAVDHYWPMNDKACGMYGGCPFRSVCDKDPSVRRNFLLGNFEKFYWNPRKER